MNYPPIRATSTPLPTIPTGQWTCHRCGMTSDSGKPQKDLLCESCRNGLWDPKGARPRAYRRLSYRHRGIETPCKAWQRDFDDDDNPIYPDGSPVAVGERLCGHRDCIAEDHIIPEEHARVA